MSQRDETLVSLEQYAGVTTALSEGFPLNAILEQERIRASAWEEASRLWPKAVAKSTELFLELIEKRRVAEDCLGRAISPLDDDPAAWMGLLGALSTSDDRGALMSGLCISAADVSRLGRNWDKKTREDPELRKKLEEHASTATPPAVVEAGPRELRPFPWTPKGALDEDANQERSPLSTDIRDAQAPLVQLASFQLSSEAAMLPATVDPDATQPPVAAPPRSLPFRKGPVVTPVAHELKEQSGETAFGTIAAISKESVAVDQTMLMSSPYAQKPVTPFERSPTPEGDGDFSIERYAALRAELMVRGEEDLATLQSFGLPSIAALMKLRARFAALFAKDRGAQEKFMRALTERTHAARRHRTT